jgi:predicted acetyltransferase
MQIRPFGPGDDIEAELDLRRRAFGPISAAGRPAWLSSIQRSIDAGAMVGAFDGRRLAGSARYHDMQQWWYGRCMPMAAVGGVKVAPEDRGRGIGTAMMARLLSDIAERGYPVSALYPATAPLYRAFGWEIAGGTYETVLPARSLGALLSPPHAISTTSGAAGPAAADDSSPASRFRRATPDDGAAIVEVKGLVHARLRHCGPNTRDPRDLHDWLDDVDHFAYLADDGFLSYRWAPENEEIAVEELIAASAATARAFWQILGSHATIASWIRACLAPDDPVHWLTKEPDAETRRATSWMLRIVDAPAAIAARGYPSQAGLSVPLELTDAALPANSGSWRLEVAGGAGILERTEPERAQGALQLGARGLAALFAGAGIGPLRLAGLVAGGDPDADDALDCAFSGPAFLLDHW